MVKELEVYGESALIISQILNKWKIKEERLMPYHECLQKWASKFSKIQYQYVPRMQNQFVDALATMEDEEKNGEGEWYSDILQYLKDGTYMKSANKND